ncbi:M56 family metallopeptidase [Lachnospiraceae bacterium 48-42]
MIWTILMKAIDVVFCLLLTSLTGSIVFVIWCILGQQLEKVGFINILYRLMKLVMIFFLVPVLYVAMTWLDDTYARYRGDLFLHTEIIMKVCGFLLLLWIAGVCYMLYRQLRLERRTKQMFQNCFPCEPQIEELFRAIEENMGITKGKVRLVRCYYTPIALLRGVRHPMVVLPVEVYSNEELEVIFRHELMHYKHNDILWRRIASVLVILHFFNPFAWKLHRVLRTWSEHACDFSVYERAGGLKHYFETIMKIQANTQGFDVYLAVTLSENKSELVERIMRMKTQIKIKKRSAWKAAAICTAMLFASSVTVFGASEGIADAYHMMYDATDVEEEVPPSPELPEYEESGEIPGIVEETGEIEMFSRSGTAFNFNWTVANGVRKVTDEFSAEAGGQITITVIVSPSNKSVKVGIVKPNGKRSYTTGSGTVCKSFSLNASGKYKVFVENNSGTKVTVNGSVSVL